MKKKLVSILLVMAIIGISSFVFADTPPNNGHRLYDSGGAVVGCKTPGSQCRVGIGMLNISNIINSTVGK